MKRSLRNFLRKFLPMSARSMNKRFDSLTAAAAEERGQTLLIANELRALSERQRLLERELEIIKRNGVKDSIEILERLNKLDGILTESLTRLDTTIRTETGRTTAYNISRNRLNTSIPKQAWALAGAQTAEYVTRNMAKAMVFPDQTKLLAHAVKLAGDGLYLEFGVYSGKTVNQIAELRPNDTVYGFDSFEGLPETWRTGFEAGKFARKDLPPVKENVSLVVGWFDETLPAFVAENRENCAFIHVDCDLYSSARTVFENLHDRIVPGTVLVFDEYFNYPSWQEHEFKAFQEFVAAYRIQYEYIGYVEAYEQAAVRILARG